MSEEKKGSSSDIEPEPGRETLTHIPFSAIEAADPLVYAAIPTDKLQKSAVIEREIIEKEALREQEITRRRQEKQRREENEKKQMLERNKKKTNVKVTDIKGNPIVFNALTEKPFRFTSKQRIDRTPELSERRARAIAYADSLSQAQTNLIADFLSSEAFGKFSDLNEAIQLIDPDGAAGAKDILSNKDEANTFLKRVLSRSNSVTSESLRSDSQDSVDPDSPIYIQGKFNKMYVNKKIFDFFDDNSFVFFLNRNCIISYNTDTDK